MFTTVHHSIDTYVIEGGSIEVAPSVWMDYNRLPTGVRVFLNPKDGGEMLEWDVSCSKLRRRGNTWYLLLDMRQEYQSPATVEQQTEILQLALHWYQNRFGEDPKYNFAIEEPKN